MIVATSQPEPTRPRGLAHGRVPEVPGGFPGALLASGPWLSPGCSSHLAMGASCSQKHRSLISPRSGFSMRSAAALSSSTLSHAAKAALS